MTAAEREELIVNTLPLIKHIAHKVAVRLPNSIEIRDLVNAGAIGLLDAIDKFEPERGVKFKTYAEVRIRGAIIDSLRSLDWAPRSLRKKSKDLCQQGLEWVMVQDAASPCLSKTRTLRIDKIATSDWPSSG